MNRIKSSLANIYRWLHPRFQHLFLEYKVTFKPRYGHGKPPHEALYAMVDANRSRYAELLEASLTYIENIKTIRDASQGDSGVEPVWNSGYLPGLDIIGIYTMLSELKPETYFEVGSGNSTKVAYKAISEQKLGTKIISVDPAPRAEIDQIADTIVRQPFEETDLKALFQLKANDVLFIDNSHRILPNSDSMVFFLEVLPKLASGVVVQIHDIYIPYDYPQFMCDRFYSEQYGLAIWLLSNPERFEILLPNYFISEDSALSEMVVPFWEQPGLNKVERHGGSFWFRIR